MKDDTNSWAHERRTRIEKCRDRVRDYYQYLMWKHNVPGRINNFKTGIVRRWPWTYRWVWWDNPFGFFCWNGFVYSTKLKLTMRYRWMSYVLWREGRDYVRWIVSKKLKGR